MARLNEVRRAGRELLREAENAVSSIERQAFGTVFGRVRPLPPSAAANRTARPSPATRHPRRARSTRAPRGYFQPSVGFRMTGPATSSAKRARSPGVSHNWKRTDSRPVPASNRRIASLSRVSLTADEGLVGMPSVSATAEAGNSACSRTTPSREEAGRNARPSPSRSSRRVAGNRTPTRA